MPFTGCAIAQAQLKAHVAGLKETPLAERLGSGIKTAYLAQIPGAVKHIGSQIFHTIDGLTSNTAATVADAFISLARGVPRTEASPVFSRGMLDTQGIGHIAERTVGGIKDFIQAMKPVTDPATGRRMWIDPDAQGDAYDFARAQLKSPLGRQIQGFIDTFVSARNKPAFEGAMAASTVRQSKILAMQEGLKPGTPQYQARTLQLRNNPTPQMAIQAHADAAEFTFSDPNVLADAVSAARSKLRRTEGNEPLSLTDRLRAEGVAQGLKGDELAKHIATSRQLTPKELKTRLAAANVPERTPTNRAQYGAAKAAGLAMDIMVPFPKIGSNIASAAAIANPGLGVLKAAINTLSAAPGTRWGTFAKALTNTTALSGAGVAAGYLLAEKGLLTGPHPVNPNITGKQANAVKLFGRWHSTEGLAPFWMGPLLGASIYERTQRHPGQTGANLLGATVDQGQAILRHSALASLGTVGDALGGKGTGDVAHLASGMVPIPPLVAQVARGTSGKRDVTDKNPVMATAKQIVARIPGAANTLPLQLNAESKPIQEGGAGELARQLTLPTNSRADYQTPVTQELDRLGLTLRNPLPHRTFGHQQVTLTPEQYHAGLEHEGPLVEQQLARAIASPGYAKASDGLKKAYLQRVEGVVHKVGMAPAYIAASQRGEITPRGQ